MPSRLYRFSAIEGINESDNDERIRHRPVAEFRNAVCLAGLLEEHLHLRQASVVLFII